VTMESAVLVLLGDTWLVTLVKVALGYAVSYTMYWSVLCSSNKALMNPALAFLLGFVIYNVCRAWQTLFFIITPALCILKAGLAALQLICGYHLYQQSADAPPYSTLEEGVVSPSVTPGADVVETTAGTLAPPRQANAGTPAEPKGSLGDRVGEGFLRMVAGATPPKDAPPPPPTAGERGGERVAGGFLRIFGIKE